MKSEYPRRLESEGMSNSNVIFWKVTNELWQVKRDVASGIVKSRFFRALVEAVDVVVTLTLSASNERDETSAEWIDSLSPSIPGSVRR